MNRHAQREVQARQTHLSSQNLRLSSASSPKVSCTYNTSYDLTTHIGKQIDRSPHFREIAAETLQKNVQIVRKLNASEDFCDICDTIDGEFITHPEVQCQTGFRGGGVLVDPIPQSLVVAKQM